MKEPELVELMKRVDFVPAGAAGVNGATEVVVTLKDGRTIAAAVPELGFNVVPDDRLPEQLAALQDKFVANVSPVLGRERATGLVDALGQLERLPSIAKLMELTETP